MANARESREQEAARRVLKHWHEAVPNDRMAHLVKDVTRSFQRSLQARLARHNISFSHWVFLRILWERDGLTQRELSIEAGLMEPTTLIALRTMETLGTVRRRQMNENRKNNHVFLTARGKRLKKLLVPMAEEVNAIALRELSQRDIDAARRSLLTMIDNLARDDQLAAAGPSKAPTNTRSRSVGSRQA